MLRVADQLISTHCLSPRVTGARDSLVIIGGGGGVGDGGVGGGGGDIFLYGKNYFGKHPKNTTITLTNCQLWNQRYERAFCIHRLRSV